MVSTSSPGVNHLRGVLHALGPGHFADVDQTLNALLELNERTVVGDGEDATANLRTDGVTLGGVEPRIRP